MGSVSTLPVHPNPAAPHQAWLRARAPEVHYSARILYQELVAQQGFLGSYDTVKQAVRPLRAGASLAALTQRRFETGPGQQAQVDWGQIKVRLASGPADAARHGASERASRVIPGSPSAGWVAEGRAVARS